MPSVVIDGSKVNYSDEGKGEVLVCIHGWMHDLSSFNQLVDELKPSYRVLSLDLPNFGKSQIVEGLFSIDDYGKFIAAFIKKLGIEGGCTLVGHSMGGQILINAIAKEYVKPKRVVLITPSGIRDRRGVFRLFIKFCSTTLRYITPKRLRSLQKNPDVDLSDVHKQVMKKTLLIDVAALASLIKVPVLLICGSADKSTPLWMGKKLSKLIKGSEIKIIEKENHWPHKTSADKVAEAIVSWARGDKQG